MNSRFSANVCCHCWRALGSAASRRMHMEMSDVAGGIATQLKVRLRKGDGVGVIWLALGSTAMAEIAGGKAPDALVIDMQHGLWNRSSMEWTVGIVACPVLVRVSENSTHAIGEALDAGAEGILVPMVETA